MDEVSNDKDWGSNGYTRVSNIDEFCKLAHARKRASSLASLRGLPFANTNEARWLFKHSRCRVEDHPESKTVSMAAHLHLFSTFFGGAVGVVVSPNVDLHGSLQNLTSSYTTAASFPGRIILGPNGMGKTQILSSLELKTEGPEAIVLRSKSFEGDKSDFSTSKSR